MRMFGAIAVALPIRGVAGIFRAERVSINACTEDAAIWSTFFLPCRARGRPGRSAASGSAVRPSLTSAGGRAACDPPRLGGVLLIRCGLLMRHVTLRRGQIVHLSGPELELFHA
jgi:hypothetical protein